jgi:hypothetical protein
MKKRTLLLLAAAVALSATVTACTFPSTQPTEPAVPVPVPSLKPSQTEPTEPDNPSTQRPPTADPTPAAVPSPAPPSLPPASSEPSDSEAPSTAEDPVATRRGSVGTVRVRGSLFPVQRSAETATVNLLIVSDDPKEIFALGSSFGDGNPEVSAKQSASVDGIRLVDPVAKRVHLAATTAEGSCVCTPTDGRGVWQFESVMWVTVAFAAPPASSTTVDVVLPVFGTVNDVPIH